MNVDRSKARPVGTAGTEVMLSQGAADAGELDQILVMGDDQLSKNLVSISRFDVSGHKIIFDEGTCTIVNKTTGLLIGTGHLDRSTMLYMIDVRKLTEHRVDLLLASAPVKATATVWHYRLGHRQMRGLLKARDEGLVTGIPKGVQITDDDRHICHSCALSKSTRHAMPKTAFKTKKMKSSARHNPRRAKTEKAVPNGDEIFDEEPSKDRKFLRDLGTTDPLHKTIREVSTDIKGPFEIKSRFGSAYYHGFIESDTKFHRPYFLKTRSEAFQATKDHWNLHIAVEDSRVVTYRSDGAKELISSDILKFLASK